MKKERIKWIDIYRAIAIILVVVGHSTGQFSQYIYQFHMAAFFFISGYTVDYKKRTVWETIRDRFCSLMLPFFFALFLVVSVEWALEHLGLRHYFFPPEIPFGGAPQTIMRLLIFGDNYLLLSASWFLIALFWIEVLQKILDCLCGGRKVVSLLISAALFLVGYYIIKVHGGLRISMYDVDLILIGQFYFAIGKIIHDLGVLEKIRTRPVLLLPLGCLSLWLLNWFGYHCPVRVQVDYPSRVFNFPVTDAAAALNGSFLVFAAAVCVEKIKYLREILIVIGRNTLGVVFFHFIFFKVGYLILYFMGVVPFQYLQNFIPTAEIGDRWWVLLAGVSLSLSILSWMLLLKIKDFFLGRIAKPAKRRNNP